MLECINGGRSPTRFGRNYLQSVEPPYLHILPSGVFVIFIIIKDKPMYPLERDSTVCVVCIDSAKFNNLNRFCPPTMYCIALHSSDYAVVIL